LGRWDWIINLQSTSIDNEPENILQRTQSSLIKVINNFYLLFRVIDEMFSSFLNVIPEGMVLNYQCKWVKDFNKDFCY